MNISAASGKNQPGSESMRSKQFRRLPASIAAPIPLRSDHDEFETRRLESPVPEPRTALPDDVGFNLVVALNLRPVHGHVDDSLFIGRQRLPEIAASVVELQVAAVPGQ